MLQSSSFVAVLQLCCSPPALLQSSNFVAVLQLCRSPPALLRSSNFVPTRMRSRLSVYYEIWTPCSRHCQGCSPSRTRRARHCRDCSAPGLHLGPASGLDLRSPRLSPLASRLSPLASPLASPPALRRMVPSARGLAVRGLRNVDPGSGIDCSGGPPRGFRPRSQRPTPHATTASWSRARCRISAVLHELQHLRRSVEPLDPLKLCQAQKNFLTIGVDQQRPQSISSHLSRSAATPVDQQEPQSISSDLSPCVTF